MKRIVVMSLLLTLGVAAPALACHFDSFTPAANCDGWSVNGSVYFTRDWADLTWDVTLSNADGVVATFNGAERIYPANPTFSYGGPWGMELCGEYTVTGTFHIENEGGSDTKTLSITFRCICDEPDGCTGTPGYWKNHPDAWPVSSLVVGGVMYTKAELLMIFDMPTRGDVSVKLFHHLVAAMLNVLSGGPTSIQGVIDDANAFMMTYGLGSHPTGCAREQSNAYKDALVAYNESDSCDPAPAPMASSTLLKAPANDQVKTWGAVKEMYKK